MKLTFLLFLALKSWAGTDVSAVCPERIERQGSIQVHQQLTPKGSCYVSVGNFKAKDGIYRSFLFTSDGSLMVFNSYGWGTDATSTGAREFYFFPRLNLVPEFAWNPELRKLQVMATSGAVFNFDYEDVRLSSVSNAQVKEIPEVRPDNQGGVDITQYVGLLLDGGFRLGKAPTSVSSAQSSFTDAYGVSCKVRNNTLFKYTSSGDVMFKYSDAELKTFLKKACSKLKP